MTLAPRRDIGQTRGLGLALPIARGDRVAVVGHGQKALLESLVKIGAEAVYLFDGSADEASLASKVPAMPVRPGDRLPIEDASVDHVIFMAVHRGWRPVAAAELARVCRSGGNVVIVVPNRCQRPWDAAAHTPRSLARQLGSHGLEPTGSYGVRQDAADVRHLVPLGGPACTWYIRNAAPSGLLRAALEWLLAAPGAPTLLLPSFPALAMTARRTGAPC